MEKYIINGVEVEYDTFDLENMETLETAVKRAKIDVEDIQARRTGDNDMALLREQANVFLDFFDDVLGEGSARKIFGERINILSIVNGYRDFTAAVAEQQTKLAQITTTPMNREQRRARR